MASFQLARDSNLQALAALEDGEGTAGGFSGGTKDFEVMLLSFFILGDKMLFASQNFYSRLVGIVDFYLLVVAAVLTQFDDARVGVGQLIRLLLQPE